MTHPDGMYASEARSEDYVSLRDHFAGLAMQGFASNTEWSRTVNDDWDDYVERMTTGAYEIADAMLKARKEVKP